MGQIVATPGALEACPHDHLLRCLAFNASGNIWVADTYNQRVEEFSSGGTYLSKFGSSGGGCGQLTFPLGVAVSTSR